MCLGNDRVCDDGIGARVGRVLQSLPLPPGARVLLLQRLSLDLQDALAEAEHLVIVDALSTGGAPGQCTVADVSELPAGIASADCAHRTSVSHVIELARHVSCDGTLQAIDIAGIEGRQFLCSGVPMSDEVLAAVPRMVDLILLAIGARVATRALVPEVCRRFLAPAARAGSWPAIEASADVRAYVTRL